MVTTRSIMLCVFAACIVCVCALAADALTALANAQARCAQPLGWIRVAPGCAAHWEERLHS